MYISVYEQKISENKNFHTRIELIFLFVTLILPTGIS
nr:MAG TPA: hypothetical protein [Caudoviricetes sp.]